MTKIFAVDFSTGSKQGEGTGYAYRDKDGNVVAGTIFCYNSKLNAWERTHTVIEALKDLIKEEGLEGYHMAIETPILGRNRKGSINLANCNGMLIGALDGLLNGFTFIDNSKWCAYHLITGKREQRKAESIELAVKHGVLPVGSKNDNTADAYGILLYAESLGGGKC